jgi:hypothetical protein
MFAESAATVRTLESCALLLGCLIDECREVTMLKTMSAASCEIAITAFKLLSKFDGLRVDLEISLIELRRTHEKLKGDRNGI